MSPRPRLGSTYRLQLNGLGFERARALVPYFDSLGIETLYLSPVLTAVPASTHGYDAIDPTRLDPSLGSPEAFEALLAELARHSMRALLDVVPNHMATDNANRWWWETLRDGQASRHAAVFDIDWGKHGGRILLPVLGRPLSEALEDAIPRTGSGGRELEIDGARFPAPPGNVGGAPLPTLLAAQHFRPAFWRTGNTEGNYRRFFDIDGLVGVRVEDPDVFARTHELILELCADERVAGVRVDHVDGLWDPAGYLARLHAALAMKGDRSIVLVEKILGRDESLDPRWIVDGTTGYEFADRALGLFLDEAGSRRLAALGSSLTGDTSSFGERARAAKREMLERSFVAQFDRLTELAVGALDTESPGHDLSAHDVRRALAELTVHLDRYRTYLDGAVPAAADVAAIAQAVPADALDPEGQRALHLVASSLRERSRPGSPWLVVAGRWQQLTGAVMAKGAEDTATYRYDGLLCHAEVGCDPDRAACTTDELNRFIRARARTGHDPRTGGGLNSTSTHDSKRNEDARCRLAVLSESASEWEGLVRRWHRRFASTAMPDPHDELVAYQTLFSLWPAEPARTGLSTSELQRVREYALKAARETKRRTSWTDPDAGYERRLTAAISRISRDDRFRQEMSRFLGAVGAAAAANAMALLVLKTCIPGVPDFYQGTETFEPALTDPDNRRAVDFGALSALLESLPDPDLQPSDLAPELRGLLAHWQSGAMKLYLTRALLHLRRELPVLFATAPYVPLEVKGPRSTHIVTLARHNRRDWVVAVLPRHSFSIAGRARFPTGGRVWSRETVLLPKAAPSTFTDIFTGAPIAATKRRLALGPVLGTLPVSVLRSTR